MSSTLKRFRSPPCSEPLALGLLLSAPAASASDTFFLKNESKVATLTGTSLWGKGNTMNAECRTGPFPGPTLTSFTFNPGDQGSITLSQDPFSECLPGINPLVDNPIDEPLPDERHLDLDPRRPVRRLRHPDLRPARAVRLAAGPAEVDGLNCTVYDASSQPAGSFTSSAAPVRGGKAVAYVQHFPGTTPARRRAARARDATS